MKKLLLIAVASCLFAGRAAADEGMWLLPLMNKLNIKDMKARGLKLSAEDIYSVNGSSLKDAIVIFGAGCTGEIVSKDGLLFTNHHCGYGHIQGLSSVEHDYLKYGFWAQNRGEEIPAPGLSVQFIRHIEDVTAKVLEGVTPEMTEQERRKAVSENSQKLLDELKSDYPRMNLTVDAFFGGNQYFMFVKEVFTDVRLVGAPPTSVGRFGGETDNWMWPRHTCDFSIFRVYAAPDGVTPAEYSSENVPYQAPVHLKISMKGYKEGDFSMIMGFPGTTRRFMTSYEIDQMLEHDNPNRIFIRGARQEVLRKYMDASDEIRIKYAAKYDMSSNYWKNSIGMSRGIRKLDVKAQKQELEGRFTTWTASHPEYKDALPLIAEAVAGRTAPMSKWQIVGETMQGAEILLAAAEFGTMLQEETGEESDDDAAGEEGDNDIADILDMAADFYKDYDETVDRACAGVMLKIMFDSVPEILPASLEAYRGDIPAMVAQIYDNSPFASYEKLERYVNAGDFTALDSDPAVQITDLIDSLRKTVAAEVTPMRDQFARGHRLLVAGLQNMDPAMKYYPDANSTLRLTYGNILPYVPADGVFYDYHTTLSGVMEKEDPLNPTQFSVPERLKELWRVRDFGPYAAKGEDVFACFVSNNDITGGNSGSPMLNAHGELIGLAFDGNWDAMSGDVAFEPNLQRTIAVDVRYVLFIVDKFAGAGWLLDEMTIVR